MVGAPRSAQDAGGRPNPVLLEPPFDFLESRVLVPALRAGMVSRTALVNRLRATKTPVATLVAVDGSHIYWANPGAWMGANGTTIGRANLDGSGANQSFISGAKAPCGVAAG